MKALENARFIEITKSSKEFMSDIEFGLSKTFFEGWSDVIEKLKFTGDQLIAEIKHLRISKDSV